MRVEVVAAGEGEPVKDGETVRVHYAVTSTTGDKLHDTRDAAPEEMVIGSTHMICRFEKALSGMRPGEQRKVSVPWQLAFGEEGRPPPAVTPRTDLVFLVDLFLPGAPDGSRGGSAGRSPASGGGGRRR